MFNLLDMAVQQVDRDIGFAHHAFVVRGHQERNAVAALDVAHQIQNGCGGAAVKVGGGLIGYHQFGFAGQRTGNGHSLALAARQFAGQVVGPIR